MHICSCSILVDMMLVEECVIGLFRLIGAYGKRCREVVRNTLNLKGIQEALSEAADSGLL